jgi:hypothetical protein
VADHAQVGAEVSALAADTVAVDAAALSFEDCPSSLDITRHLPVERWRAQAAHEGAQLPDLFIGKGESGHVGAGNALLNVPKQRFVIGPPHAAPVDQVGTAAALAVGAVAAAAGYFKQRSAGGDGGWLAHESGGL